MPDVDEINSNLGALEQQLEELSRLKGLVQSLSEREAAANEAVQAAEQASASSKEVIDRFEEATTRIEGAEAVEHLEEIEDTIRRFEEVGSELETKVAELPGAMNEPLVEYHEKMRQTLSEALTDYRERLNKAESSLDVLQNALEQRIDNHHTEVTDDLTRIEEEQEKCWDQTSETLEEIGSEIVEINDLLEDAQIRSRLDTLQDTASNANQAAQNGLSRIDAAERSLSDTLDEQRRRQDRRADRIEEDIADLRDQLSDFETSTRWLLWFTLAIGFFSLVLSSSLVYAILF